MVSEPINGVVVFLKADVAVSSIAGVRVFNEELPESENTSMPRPTIVVSSAGGGLMGNANNFGDRRLDIDCYGVTLAEARRLYSAVRKALKELRREAVADSPSTSVLLHWARISADGTTYRDPETDWPTCGSSWQVLASDTSIA